MDALAQVGEGVLRGGEPAGAGEEEEGAGEEDEEGEGVEEVGHFVFWGVVRVEGGCFWLVWFGEAATVLMRHAVGGLRWTSGRSGGWRKLRGGLRQQRKASRGARKQRDKKKEGEEDERR